MMMHYTVSSCKFLSSHNHCINNMLSSKTCLFNSFNPLIHSSNHPRSLHRLYNSNKLRSPLITHSNNNLLKTKALFSNYYSPYRAITPAVIDLHSGSHHYNNTITFPLPNIIKSDHIYNNSYLNNNNIVINDNTAILNTALIVNDSKSSLLGALPLGLFAGCIGSMSGVGGAVVLVPLSAILLKYDQKSAAASGVLCTALTALIGSFTFAANNCIHIPSAFAICLGASATIGIGAKISTKVDNRTLQMLLGILFIIMAPMVYFRAQSKEKKQLTEIDSTSPPLILNPNLEKIALLPTTVKDTLLLNSVDMKNFQYIDSKGSPLQHSYLPYAVMIGGGSLMGIINGTLGLGGGISLITGLTMTSDYHKLPYPAIAGTALSALIIPSLIGAAKHYRLGNLRTRHLPLIMLGTALGASIGAELAIHLPQEQVKTIFATVLGMTGIRSLLKIAIGGK